MYGQRQRPSHLICGLCPSITDTSFAQRFPHMLIIHAVLDHDVSLEDVARSRRVDAPFVKCWLEVAGQSGVGRAVDGDGLPGLRRIAPGCCQRCCQTRAGPGAVKLPRPIFYVWWGRPDSNRHALRHMLLRHARLPFRHSPIEW